MHKKMSGLIKLLLLTFLVTSNNAARILAYFPVPSISHHIVFRTLTEELARKGHDVTVITTDPAFPKGKTPANLTEIDVHDLSYDRYSKVYEFSSSGKGDLIELVRVSATIMEDIIEMQLKEDKVQEVLKEKFDLLLLEAIIRPALLLSHVIKAPVIQVSSFGPVNMNVEVIGSAWHPFLYPNTFAKRLYNLSTWEKLLELWTFYNLENIVNAYEDVENEKGKLLFGPNIPPMSELKNNVDMLFLNIHPIWDGNRPVPPNVIYLGGLHQKPLRKLPADLRRYLDSSKNGVIYISFGTNVQPSLLPPERVQLMAKVFSELPYDVLWKWNNDKSPGRSKNIRTSAWLPQSDLLRHPKIKLFITQGGLQSTDEAITAGVPLIGIPMTSDQWFNVQKYVHHKIGIQLDLLSMTEDDFKNAINTVIEDESYRQNIVKLRSIMSDQPQPPLERAVWWTEYVLRHGGAKHLRSPAANMSWAQYLELELVFTVLAIVFVLIVLLSFLIYKLCKYLSYRFNEIKLKIN